MPGARIEIAERLVLDLVHLGEHFDAHHVGVAVIGRDVVADDVAARAPDQMDLVARRASRRRVWISGQSITSKAM